MINIDDLLPSKDPNEIAKATKTIGIIGWGIFFVGFIAFIFEGTPMQNTINEGKYWLIGTSIGVVLFIGVTIFLKLKHSSVFDEKTRRNSVLWCYFAGPICWTLAIIGFINTTFANSTIECRNFTIADKSISYGRYGTEMYYIHCSNKDDDVQMKIDKTSWDELKENETIKLYLKKGYFGSEYVTSFQILNQ